MRWSLAWQPSITGINRSEDSPQPTVTGIYGSEDQDRLIFETREGFARSVQRV